MFKICGEVEPPHEGECLRYMVSRNRQMRGVFSMFDEPESPNEGAHLRYMVKIAKRVGVLKIWDEPLPLSPNEGHVQDM